MAERVGRQGKVLAFEPFRWLFQICTANVALNGLSNVWTFNMGLGEAILGGSLVLGIISCRHLSSQLTERVLLLTTVPVRTCY